jgi:O-6-methylguanine DNA methyltransferase
MATGTGNTLIFKTPWGWAGLAASAAGVRAIVLPKASRQSAEREIRRTLLTLSFSSLGGEAKVRGKILREATAQVQDFLAGRRRDLDFPVDLSGGTPFQRRVWHAARRIPYGRVRAYKWIAARVGGRRYARAVGLALGANPVPIAVPCHRVVAQDGSLGGFSGGLPTKRRLLELEGTFPQLKS